MQSSKFEISKGRDGQFYFHLYAQNAKNILDSEGYSNKISCSDGIASVKKNAVDESCFKLKTASNGEFYFVLIAGNGEIIGKSEMYSTKQACNNGIESVKTNAPQAAIEDRS